MTRNRPNHHREDDEQVDRSDGQPAGAEDAHIDQGMVTAELGCDERRRGKLTYDEGRQRESVGPAALRAFVDGQHQGTDGEGRQHGP